MQAFGMLLLAAATAGDGFGYGEASAGHKHWLRSHVVTSSDAPGPPPYNGQSLASPGATGLQNGRRFINTRSQIYFLDPNGMQIGWQNGTGPNGERSYLQSQLTVPARYNFNQGFIYRLKITNIPGRAATALYPTIEVAPTTPATDAYLAHNAIPLQLTAEDFDQVIDGGNFVTKVIYLPDPKYQELAVSGVETLVSTRLEPGVDPILEADRRGTILLILRLGAIDLEMPGLNGPPIFNSAPVVGSLNSGATIISNGSPVGANLPPGALPPGMTPSPAPAAETISLDPAPADVKPAPSPEQAKPTAPAPPTPAPNIAPEPSLAPEAPPATAPGTGSN
jgi:hypothetical protein